jgi:hypothetical protein
MSTGILGIKFPIVGTTDGMYKEVSDNYPLPVAMMTALTRALDSITAHQAPCNLSVISKTTDVVIGAGAANDTLLVSVEITAALTGTCVIAGFADSDGTAQSITLPAATPAGVIPFDSALNTAGALTFTCSNAADDNKVNVRWRAA